MSEGQAETHPILRMRERGHRQAAWSELFFDLVFVVVVAQLAHAFAEDLSLPALWRFVALFALVWWAWVGEVQYTTRFDSDRDRTKRFLGTVQLARLSVMALLVGHGGLERLGWLVVAYVVVRAMQLLELWRAARYVPEARGFARHYLLWQGTGLALWLAALALPPSLRLVGWGLAFAIELGSYVAGRRLHREHPPHVTHVPERFGLFTILVLGESFAAIATGLGHAPLGLASLGMVTLGVLVAVGLWWTYFDRLDDDAVRALEGQGRTAPYLIWLWAHLPLSLGLAGTGAALSRTLGDHPIPQAPAWLAGMLALYFAAEMVVCATTVGAGLPALRVSAGVLARGAAGLALVALGALVPAPRVVLLGAALTVWIVVAADLVERAARVRLRASAPP